MFSSAYVFDNAWHHVAVTYDGARLKWYIDGVLNLDTAETGDMPSTTASLLLGKDAIRSAYFNGVLDEVNIYSRVLDANEVSARYNATNSLRSNQGVALGGSRATLSYYLGGRQVALKKGADLQWVHQDHLTGTALMTDGNGGQVGSAMKYLPFGAARSGTVPTDKKFTGQRLDSSGLYYYGARMYDPELARFISADTIVPAPANPQAFNRYSYALNNPLRYIDPTGHEAIVVGGAVIAPIFTQGLERFDPARHESYGSVFERTDSGGQLDGHIVVLARDRETGAVIPVAPATDNPNPMGMASAHVLDPYQPDDSGPSAPGGGIQTGVGKPTPTPPARAPTPIPTAKNWSAADVRDLVEGTTGMVTGAMTMTFGYALVVSGSAEIIILGPPGFIFGGPSIFGGAQLFGAGSRGFGGGLDKLRELERRRSLP